MSARLERSSVLPVTLGALVLLAWLALWLWHGSPYGRYLHHGDRWIEAAYKGLPLLSWQEVVVGDPLCQLTP